MTATAETLIGRAHDLAAEIRQRAREVDGASKLPDDLVGRHIEVVGDLGELVSLNLVEDVFQGLPVEPCVRDSVLGHAAAFWT